MAGEGDRKVALFFYMKKSFLGQKTPDYLGYPKENLTFAVIQPNKSIMKKSLIALLSVWVAGSLNAQVLDGNKFGDNWSIGVNGGIVSPLTHSAFLKNARAVVGLDIDKQLSPIYGLTLESNWTVNTVSPMAWQYSHTAFDAFDVMLLNRVNLNRLFAGYVAGVLDGDGYVYLVYLSFLADGRREQICKSGACKSRLARFVGVDAACVE